MFMPTVCVMSLYFLCVLLFFFFKQKTSYEMRISDWSSDVCSSDLVSLISTEMMSSTGESRIVAKSPPTKSKVAFAHSAPPGTGLGQIGRASCRESVWQYV